MNTPDNVHGIFLLLTCRDMFFGQSQHDEHQDVGKTISTGNLREHHSMVDTPHVASFHAIPSVKIQYCHSCGYRQAFDEISKLLQNNFPDIKVEGEYHQPNWLRSQIVNLLFVLKIVLIILIYMDINPFNYLQMETPRLWTQITQSKVPASLFILFITNSIESNMMSTGAFEIYYNDMPVWSRLTTPRMPLKHVNSRKQQGCGRKN